MSAQTRRRGTERYLYMRYVSMSSVFMQRMISFSSGSKFPRRANQNHLLSPAGSSCPPGDFSEPDSEDEEDEEEEEEEQD